MNIIKFVRGVLMALNVARFKKLFDRAKAALVENLELKATIADLTNQLAGALANDVADAQMIATAQAEYAIASEVAEAAKAALAPLQAAIDADASEDQQINALLDSIDLGEDEEDDEEEEDGGEQ
jgi:hypothetical protein